MLKVSVISGVLGGLLFLPFYYLLSVTGMNPMGFYGFLDICIPVLAIVSAIYIYRKNQPNNELHLWEGLIIGFITNTILALMAAASIYVFIEYIDVEGIAFKEYIDNEITKWTANKEENIKLIGEQKYESMLVDLNNTDVIIMAKTKAFWKFIFGFPLVIIISMILRKKNYTTTTNL